MAGGEKDELVGTELDDGKEPIVEEVEEELPAAEEAEDTEEGQGDAGEEEAPVVKQAEGRASKAIQELKRERNEERDRAKQLQDQLQSILTRQADQVSQQNGQSEQQKLQEMEPHDRVAYLANKQAEALQGQIAKLQFQVQDTQDQARFQAKAAADPLYGKYVDKVEQKLQEMQSQGVTTTRDAILKYYVGEDLLAKREGAGGIRAKAAAAQRIASATGKTIGVRGATPGTKSGKSLEERLTGVLI